MIVKILKFLVLLSSLAITVGTGESGCSNVTISSEAHLTCNGMEVNITDCANATELENCTTSEVMCSSACDPVFCRCPAPPDADCTCYYTLCTLPCSNGETCTAINTCYCPEEWNGDVCQQLPNVTCTEGFCLNGGTCKPGDTNCTCQEGWTGVTCNESLVDSSQNVDRNRTIIIISSTIGACVLVLTPVAILLIYAAVYQYRRKRRVKFIQANIRVPPTPTEPASISDTVLYGESIAYEVPEDTKAMEAISSQEALPKEEDDLSLKQDSLDTKEPIEALP